MVGVSWEKALDCVEGIRLGEVRRFGFLVGKDGLFWFVVKEKDELKWVLGMIEDNRWIILDDIIRLLVIEKLKVEFSEFGVERRLWEGYIWVMVMLFIFISGDIFMLVFYSFIGLEEKENIGLEGKSVLNFWGFLSLERFVFILFNGEIWFVFIEVVDKVLSLSFDFMFFFVRFLVSFCWNDEIT